MQPNQSEYRKETTEQFTSSNLFIQPIHVGLNLMCNCNKSKGPAKPTNTAKAKTKSKPGNKAGSTSKSTKNKPKVVGAIKKMGGPTGAI